MLIFHPPGPQVSIHQYLYSFTVVSSLISVNYILKGWSYTRHPNGTNTPKIVLTLSHNNLIIVLLG